MKKLINRFRNWWSENRDNITESIHTHFQRIDESLARGFRRLLIFSLFVIIAISVSPEAAEKYPVIGGLAQYFLSFYEWLFKFCFVGLVTFFTEGFKALNEFAFEMFDQLFDGLKSMLAFLASLK